MNCLCCLLIYYNHLYLNQFPIYYITEYNSNICKKNNITDADIIRTIYAVVVVFITERFIIIYTVYFYMKIQIRLISRLKFTLINIIF